MIGKKKNNTTQGENLYWISANIKRETSSTSPHPMSPVRRVRFTHTHRHTGKRERVLQRSRTGRERVRMASHPKTSPPLAKTPTAKTPSSSHAAKTPGPPQPSCCCYCCVANAPTPNCLTQSHRTSLGGSNCFCCARLGHGKNHTHTFSLTALGRKKVEELWRSCWSPVWASLWSISSRICAHLPPRIFSSFASTFSSCLLTHVLRFLPTNSLYVSPDFWSWCIVKSSLFVRWVLFSLLLCVCVRVCVVFSSVLVIFGIDVGAWSNVWFCWEMQDKILQQLLVSLGPEGFYCSDWRPDGHWKGWWLCVQVSGWFYEYLCRSCFCFGSVNLIPEAICKASGICIIFSCCNFSLSLWLFHQIMFFRLL